MVRSVLMWLCAGLAQGGWAQTQPLDVQSALQLAAQNRPAARAAKLRLEQAKLSARALGTPPPTSLGIGYSHRATIGASDQDAFISQPIDLFGRTQAGRQAGAARVQQAEANYRGELLDLQTDVIGALAEAVSAIKLSAIGDSTFKNAEQLKAAVDRKFDEGRVAEVQQTRAGIEVMRARQNRDLRRTRKAAAMRRLSAELGTSVTEEQLTAFPQMAELPAGDVSQRPELLRIAADVSVAKAEIGLARTSARPELEIQGLRSPWHDAGAQFGARIQLSWAIFDFGKARYETKSAEKQMEAGGQSLEDARQKAEAELSATLAEFSGAKALVDSYRPILESARILLRKTQVGYDEGASTLIDVLEATRALREVEEGSVEAEQRLVEASIAVYRAAGVLAGGLK